MCLQAVHSIMGELKTTLTLLSKLKHDKPSPPPNKQTHSHELQAGSGNPGVLASTAHKHRASKRQRERRDRQTNTETERMDKWTALTEVCSRASTKTSGHLLMGSLNASKTGW